MQKINLYSSAYGSYPLEVVGESNYQYEIKIIMNYEDSKSSLKEDGFTAELILEDNNIHDRGNAVRVDVDGKTVGYLSRSDAKKYRKSLSSKGFKNVIATCYAAISGRYNDDVEDVLFGVRLDLNIDQLIILPNSTPAKLSNKKVNNLASSNTPNNKSVIQSIVDIWNKGLIEKIGLIFAALIILNFLFQVWKGL